MKTEKLIVTKWEIAYLIFAIVFCVSLIWFAWWYGGQSEEFYANASEKVDEYGFYIIMVCLAILPEISRLRR